MRPPWQNSNSAATQRFAAGHLHPLKKRESFKDEMTFQCLHISEKGACELSCCGYSCCTHCQLDRGNNLAGSAENGQPLRVLHS